MDYFAYRLWFYTGGNLRRIRKMAKKGSIEMREICSKFCLLSGRAGILAITETNYDPVLKKKIPKDSHFK